ncbi:hypothetical protein Scep_024280 [Stephania cephalantha]|uniref:Uncharacterized protein n=1 Tax=Stephania cephalantha TaxID=152367 RepID=A0AAP0EZ08_9MAGN
MMGATVRTASLFVLPLMGPPSGGPTMGGSGSDDVAGAFLQWWSRLVAVLFSGGDAIPPLLHFMSSQYMGMDTNPGKTTPLSPIPPLGEAPLPAVVTINTILPTSSNTSALQNEAMETDLQDHILNIRHMLHDDSPSVQCMVSKAEAHPATKTIGTPLPRGKKKWKLAARSSRGKVVVPGLSPKKKMGYKSRANMQIVPHPPL